MTATCSPGLPNVAITRSRTTVSPARAPRITRTCPLGSRTLQVDLGCRPRVQIAQIERPELDHVAVLQDVPRNPRAVHERTAVALQVLEDVIVAHRKYGRVFRIHGRIVDDQRVIRLPADG